MTSTRRNARRQPPSIKRRWVSMLPGAQRFGQKLLSTAAVLLMGFALYLALEALRMLPVERIVVTGKLEHLRQDAIRQALAPKLDSGLLFLDLSDLRDELESLPWVYRAQLRRRFPDTLEVRVIEQLPIARWGDANFLNHEARIIEVSDAQRWQDLPQIRGPEGSEARIMNQYQRLLEQLRPVALNPVEVGEDEFGQLHVAFANGLDLHLGDRDFRLRVQRFLKLWSAELSLQERRVVRIDMRYDGGAAVAFETTPQVADLMIDTRGR